MKIKTGILHLAADTKEEMKQWKIFCKKRHLARGSPSEEGMHSFLWMQQENKWSRHYFIADFDTLEWFKTGRKNVVCKCTR